MLTLQHIFGILLLVYCVALSQGRKVVKSGTSNHYENGGQSSDISEDSGENVPFKFGRIIYHSAWSTEDMESNEEKVQNDKSVKRGDNDKKPWTLSNLLRITYDYVNKLRGESAFPATEKNNEKNFPKSKNNNVSEGKYLQLFKKWLKENKIFDSIPSDLLENDSHIDNYNHKGRQMKPRKKPNRNFKSSKNQNQNHSEKRSRIKNSKPYINDKHDHQTPTRNYKFNKKNCHSSKSLDKNEHKNSGEFINTNKNNRRIEEKQPGFTQLETDDRSTGTDASSSSDSDLKSPEEIYPETQTITSLVSDTFDFNPKQRERIPNLQTHSPKATTLTNFKTTPDESGSNKATTHNLKEHIVKATEPNDGQNNLQNQNVLKLKPGTQSIVSLFTEKPIEHTSNDSQIKSLKKADDISDTDHPKKYEAKQRSNDNSTTSRSDSERFPSAQSLDLNTNPEKLSENPKIAENISLVNTPLSSTSQPQSKSNQNEKPNNLQSIQSAHLEIVPENVSSSNPQNKEALKVNSTNSPASKKVVPEGSPEPQTRNESILKEISNSIPIDKNISTETSSSKDIPSQPQDKNILKENPNGSQVAQNLSLETVPTSGSSSKIVGESIPKELESAQHVTPPKIVSSSKSQSIKIKKGNSQDPQGKEKVSPAEMLASSFVPQTAHENISKGTSNNLPLSNSSSQATVSSKDSRPQLQNENTPRESSKDLHLTENFPSSSSKTADENVPKEIPLKKSNENDNPNKLTVVLPVSTILENQESEQSEMDSSIISEETDLQSNQYAVSNILPVSTILESKESEQSEMDSSIISEETDQQSNQYAVSSILPVSTILESKEFEQSEMDSSIISEETDQQSKPYIDTKPISDRKNNYASTALKKENFSKNPEKLNQKSELTKDLSFTSSSVEDSSDNDMNDQASENKVKHDTFLQYIYKHSNSPYFLSLRKKSNSG